MQQSRLESFIEASLNTFSGLLLAGVVQWIILKYALDVPNALTHTIWTVPIFTVVSLLRSYFWRRFFANDIHKKVHDFLRN